MGATGKALVEILSILHEGGSSERKQILDALRRPVAAELKKAVVFKVDRLKVQEGWAFMQGIPQQPSGKPINYEGTPYQIAKEAGAFDDGICALQMAKSNVGFIAQDCPTPFYLMPLPAKSAKGCQPISVRELRMLFCKICPSVLASHKKNSKLFAPNAKCGMAV